MKKSFYYSLNQIFLKDSKIKMLVLLVFSILIFNCSIGFETIPTSVTMTELKTKYIFEETVEPNENELNGIQFEINSRNINNSIFIQCDNNIYEYSKEHVNSLLMTHRNASLLNALSYTFVSNEINKTNYEKPIFLAYLTQYIEEPDVIEIHNLEASRDNIKPGDKWYTSTKVVTPFGGLDWGNTFFNSIDEYNFTGIVEIDGLRLAIINITQIIYSHNLDASNNIIGSSAYINIGDNIIAYDYENKIIKESFYNGNFNYYNGGALGIPISFLEDESLDSDVKEAIRKVDIGNFFTAGDSGAWGFVGGIFQMVGIIKARKIVRETLPIYENLSPEVIRNIAEIFLASSIYPYQFKTPVSYSVLYQE